MKRSIVLFFVSLLAVAHVHAQDEYYFGGRGSLNPDIPTPESFFGFRIGTALVRYDKVVEYFKLLADKSDRASLQVFGKSWEDREQVKLFVTSPDNQRNLENIRQEHIKLADPSASVATSGQKVIVELAYNVHGGEIAGTDASVLVAYYLVASEDPDIVRRLNDAVVLIEPSQNPDGRERAANYINGFHSWPPIADPADVEHGSGVTPHRGNHFWNDLNRDWLALAQIESRNRVAFYHKWYPNVYLDFHEMGSSSTYYFEPSPLTTWNKILPKSNYEVLNAILAKHFSASLNSIGSLYYTKESFTNLSPIYGSTYPDYQGGVGTTLEVGSTSGVVIETAAGLRPFSKNLRDNFLISIAAVRAATDEKDTFLKHQQEFFKSALTQADKLATKYIVFGSKTDKSLNNLFLEHLLQHHIDVYELTASFSQDDKTFEAGSAYVVPLRQPQFRVLQSIFEENETNGFSDTTTFYDISAWSTVHGYGIPFVKVKTAVKEGPQLTQVPAVAGSVTARSELAYAFDYFDYLTPKALYYLQDHGVKARVAQRPFTSKTSVGDKSFVAGSIVIPVAYQSLSSDELYTLLNEAAKLANVTVYAISDGFSVAGIDLGSNNIRVLKKPAVAAITGGNWTSIGELWALLGNTHHIPLVKITPQSAERVDLSNYTSIILSGGQLSPELSRRLTDWVENGGTLIALSGAAQWASSLATPAPAGGGRGNQRGTSTADTTDAAASTTAQRGRGGLGGNGGSRLNGIIVHAELNLSHPLAYGFTSKDFYTLKNSTSGLRQTGSSNVVLKTTTGELVNGYATPEALSELTDNVVIASATRGRGSIVIFGESPTFRGYWLAPGRILTNAIFFGGGSGNR
ncbi:M14 family metallopeptidase [Parapedobacter koreensis]|uniref:Zinc carboxypeptidase n=1 Tax=Parapedobacter koreensis TaxID=332977 RepID=A0A1H7GPK4_9SPHI|nr:M14 family metallopeptidase [Parapedobacter koreensis]SEK40093.1 Zinc carboxypeptidase [Parapedobacter koreensis]